MADLKALETSDQVILCLKKSGLNFLVQETPFAAFITIRKKFYKDFKKPPEANENIVQDEKTIRELQKENEILKEKMFELETSGSEKVKAEKEMLKHFEDARVSKAKLFDEISTLKYLNKKNSDIIAENKIEMSKEEKKAKSFEKTVHNLGTKIHNLNEQVANLKIIKN